MKFVAACLRRDLSPPLSIRERSRRSLGHAAVRIGRVGRPRRPRGSAILHWHRDRQQHSSSPLWGSCAVPGAPRGLRPVPSLFLSTTAYSGAPGDGTLGLERLSFRLPLAATLPNTHSQEDRLVVEVDAFRDESEWRTGMDLMNQVIREGKSWPFEEEFATLDGYRAYFLSHAAFCVRDASQQQMLGCFYVKPNFPGRCSHVCNGGFITAPEARNRGVATLMGRVYLQAAKDLGYRSSYFNLVFANNRASVNLWESLGFERVAVLPKAARTKGCGGGGDDDDDEKEGSLEAAYGYWYDLDALPPDYLSRIVTF